MDQQQPPNVFFALNATPKLLANLPRPALVVLPIDDRFNDFALHFRTEVLLLDADGSSQTLPSRLMFEVGDDTRAVLSDLTAEAAVRVETVALRFCFMFGDEDGYEALVALLGPDAARMALRALKDVVLLEAEGSTEIEDLTRSQRFALGVVRDAATYKARRRAARRLSPRPSSVSDVTESFSAVVQLPKRSRPVEVQFDFTPDAFLRDRMAVLIGPNGIGKTSVLASLINAFRTDLEHFVEPPQLTPRPQFNRLIVVACTPSDVYPTTIAPWSGLDYHFITTLPQSRADAQDQPASRDKLTEALVDILRDADRLFVDGEGDAKLTRLRLLKQVLPDSLWSSVRLPLLDDGPAISGATRTGGQYLIGLADVTGEMKRLIVCQNVDIKRPPVHVGRAGVRTLSSGELSLFRLAVQLVSAVEPASLVLVDEPETHLHPRFVSQTVELLDRLLKGTQSVAIIATHSPFVVREVPRKRVLILKFEGSNVVAVQPHLQTFGANIDSIARVVFADADSDADHLHEKLIDHWLKSDEAKGLDIDAIIERYGDDLNPEMLSYIARFIGSTDR